MPIIALKIPTRQDELTTLGAFVLVAYKIDLSKFTDFSPDYTVLHGTEIETEMKAIDLLVNPKVTTAELKVITKRIYINQDIVVTTLSLLEGYINRAVGLTIDPKDFGISDARKSNRSGDIEALVTNMETISKNVNDPINKVALAAKGYTDVKQTAFEALTKSLKDDNTSQNSKINAHSLLVKNNHVAFNNLWVKLNDICDAGKRIFLKGAAEKKNQYTVSVLKGRMRNDALKTEISGNVAPKGRIELKPLTGGRKRVINADPKGVYSQKGIKPGDYLAKLIVNGVVMSSKDVKIVTGVNLVENF